MDAVGFETGRGKQAEEKEGKEKEEKKENQDSW
jgi:hypothetical protein